MAGGGGVKKFSIDQEMKRPKVPLYDVDPDTVRPMRDLMFVRVFDEDWSQVRGIWAPPGNRNKGDSPRDFGGAISKTHAQEVIVIAVGPKVEHIRPGQRIIIPTHSAVGGCLFNERPVEVVNASGRLTKGNSYDFFVPEKRFRWERFTDPRVRVRKGEQPHQVIHRVSWGAIAIVEGD